MRRAVVQPDGSFAMICGRLTAYRQQHGDGGEGPGEALAAHEDGAVLLGQQAHQAEQAPLQNSAKRWRHHRNRLTRYDSGRFENRVRGSARPGPAQLGSAHSQLMNQMVAMVTEKNRSCSMCTLTSTAVKMKSSRMKMRLPAMRTASDTLQAQTLTSVKQRRGLRQYLPFHTTVL